VSHPEEGLIALLVVAVAVGVAVVGWLAKEQRIGPGVVRALAVLCGLGLLVMLLTDWPFGGRGGSGFWDDNGVLAGVLSTVLLLGVGFLAYESGELRAQQRLDSSLTAAGVGGIVDHLVDVDVALGLIGSDLDPTAHGWSKFATPGRPLHWVRQHPSRLVHGIGSPPDLDPRTWAAVLPPTPDDTWRGELADQCIRRLLAAIRDWSPVINTSRNGTRILISIAELRKDLMELMALLNDDTSDPVPLLISLRQRARLLSAFLEELSGADPPRAEILMTFAPVQPDGELEWAADHRGRDVFGVEWRSVLEATERRLRAGEPVS
jgi:hypothetical protein